jgi:hypothetical protein
MGRSKRLIISLQNIETAPPTYARSLQWKPWRRQEPTKRHAKHDSPSTQMRHLKHLVVGYERLHFSNTASTILRARKELKHLNAQPARRFGLSYTHSYSKLQHVLV